MYKIKIVDKTVNKAVGCIDIKILDKAIEYCNKNKNDKYDYIIMSKHGNIWKPINT